MPVWALWSMGELRRIHNGENGFPIALSGYLNWIRQTPIFIRLRCLHTL